MTKSNYNETFVKTGPFISLAITKEKSKLKKKNFLSFL